MYASPQPVGDHRAVSQRAAECYQQLSAVADKEHR